MHLRIQRYGWDAAADHYGELWSGPLARAHAEVMDAVAPVPGERVLDVACGPGALAFEAARRVGPRGRVTGVDLSGRMVDLAAIGARAGRHSNVALHRMDAQALDLPDDAFDVAWCSLGLMYMPDPGAAVREIARVLAPGGRVVLAVWGRRARCGWSPLFEIVDAEIASAACPLFFAPGEGDALAGLCEAAGFESVAQHRIATTLHHEDADRACEAAFVGGPVALAWSRFDDAARARVRTRYLDAIAPWWTVDGYALPGEFVIAKAVKPARAASSPA